HTVVEAALALPWPLRIRGNQTKYALKRAMADLLPDEILRRPKQGFGVPVAHWFRGELRELAHDVLSSRVSRERGYFSAAGTDALLAAHESGLSDHGHRLWALVVLELWFRRFLDEDASRVPAVA
ncbi:MAG: asparagine synthase-related protein, partial [Vicinamibacterales bacterium]